MRNRPTSLTLLALSLFLMAISIPIQILIIYEHDLSELSLVLAKMTYLNWLVVSVGLGAGLLVLRASPWSLIALPFLFIAVAFNNWLVGHFATDFSSVTAAIATGGFAFLHLPLLQPRVRKLLKNPQSRWWLRPRRKRLSLPIFIGAARNMSVRSETFDVSESGAFIAYPKGHSASQLDPRQPISISLSFGAYSQLRCTGHVVRRSQQSGLYPAGIGIRFDDLTFAQKRTLRRYLSYHNDIESIVDPRTIDHANAA